MKKITLKILITALLAINLVNPILAAKKTEIPVTVNLVQDVSAAERDYPNNKFGMHLAMPQIEDIKKVKDLVNSTGGDWGYVVVVIQEDDRNTAKWQEVFDLMRENHLIPIVRLATKPEGASWKRPEVKEAENWANFLNSLNWVVKDRYIILFNEPDHGAEWGGAVDPHDFADKSLEYAKIIKEKNPDFFIMMAGFDASTPSKPPQYEDEHVFLKKVFEKISVADFEKYFDGWSSHSYPNPAFSSPPWKTGRISLRTYEWELEALKGLGVNKELPVFITETGWSDKGVSRDTIASYYQYAFENIWLPDSRVMAVTPFVFNYQSEPFLDFSWKTCDSSPRFAYAAADNEFYPQYYQVQSLSKTKGDPVQDEKGKITFGFPRELVANSSYNLRIKMKNNGQAIWDKDDGYHLRLEGYESGSYFFSDLKKIKPNQEMEVTLHLKTGESGENSTKIALYKDERKILDAGDWTFNIRPLPSLNFLVSAYPKLSTEGNDFEIQIFDVKEGLIFKKSGLNVKKNKGVIDDIQNIILGEKYRVVVLRPYYLPRQKIIVFKAKDNEVRFDKMLPLDFNFDGKLDLSDLPALKDNLRLFKMFIP